MEDIEETVSACVDDDSEAECRSLNSTTDGSGTSEQKTMFIPPWPLQVAYILAFVSMVVVAAGGNLIVIWIVLAHKRMRTVTNYFLVNLAVADALISIFNTLFCFVYMLYRNWVFGRAYCKFTQFIAPCTISASVFTFMAIAIDRYSAIMHPLKPRMGAVRVVAAIGAIWLAAVAIALPNLLYAETFTFETEETICYLNWPDGVHNTTDFVYNICQIVVNYVAPLSALTITYTLVGRQLWGSQAIGERTAGQEETIRSKRRVVKMLIVVVIIFAVCWLPQHVYFLITNFYSLQPSYVQHIYLVIYWVAMSNSMYNPIMYCWMNARFRNGFKFVFRWLPCIKWQPNDALGIGGAKLIQMSATDGGTVYRLGGATDRNGTTNRQTTVISCLSDSPEHENNISMKTAKAGRQKQKQQKQLTANYRSMTVKKEDVF